MTKSKEITTYDLARKLNISIATVSSVLKDNAVASKKNRKKISLINHLNGVNSIAATKYYIIRSELIIRESSSR